MELALKRSLELSCLMNHSCNYPSSVCVPVAVTTTTARPYTTRLPRVDHIGAVG
ncbi:MAG: hypothetical protein V8S27_09780 [Lachnospiraceae bacterium]